MEQDLKNNEMFQASHMMILLCYTIFSCVLIGESVLLSWERWALVLIAIGVVVAWTLHIQQRLNSHTRLWMYSLLMMVMFFYYGTHATSTYDLAGIMTAVIMLYTMTGIKSLILLCQATFFLTFFYDLIGMVLAGETFDSLGITRSMLHGAVILIVGWIGRTIIDRWGKVLGKSREEIEELRDTTMRLNDFLANVSHEIRTPVNAVTGLTEVCIENEENEKIKADMEAVREAGRRISEQIGDILDYTEIDSGRLTSNHEDYMLSSVLNDLMMEIAPLRRSEIELIVDVDPEIPMLLNSDVGKLKTILRHLIKNALKYTKEGGAYMRMSAIPEEYGINLCIEVTDTGIGMTKEEQERILEGFYQGDSSRSRIGGGLGLGLSIVSGFVSSMGGFLTVKSQEGAGTTVRVSLPQKVVDSKGCISIRDRKKLCLGAFIHFEKFSNANVREYYNTMMKHVVQGFGVQIHRVSSLESLRELCAAVELTHLLIGPEEYEMDSAWMEQLAKKMFVVVAAGDEFVPQPSSRVVILKKPVYCFPLAELLNMEPGERLAGTERMLLTGVIALVVDDEPMNLVVAKEVLRRYGMEIETAASGFEAIELCKEKEYDLVFMDHMMPGMDGIEAMKRIRTGRGRDKRGLPVVALTANAVSTAKEMFLSEGFDGFVSKPIERSELERVLKKVLPKTLVEYVEDTEQHTEQQIEKEHTENAKTGTGLEQLESYGIWCEEGISYCGQNEELYHTLLHQFVLDSSAKRAGLEQALQAQDFKNYEILVHGLKSTSKTIGARELSEMARELEKAAKEGREIDLFKHQRLIEQHQRIVAGIAGFLGMEEELPPKEDGEILEFAPE